MNDAQKRRKILLEQTRNLYRDGSSNPAVHPRYKTAYNQIYSEENICHKSTFGIRCVICVLILSAYIMTMKENEMFWGMNQMQIQGKIMQDYTLKLY